MKCICVMAKSWRSRNIYYYYQCWKQFLLLDIFVEIHIFLFFSIWKTIEYKVQKIDLKLIEDDNLIISVPFNLKYFLMNRKFKEQHLFKIYILFINVFVPSVFNHLIGP